MKYTFIERIIWYVMSGTIFKFLKSKCKGCSIKAWKKRSNARYKEIIGELDDIGSIKKNPLRRALSGGSLWIAIYETSRGNMDEVLFGEMVIATMDSSIMRKMFQSRKPFSIEAQKKNIEMNKIANNMSNSPFNWKTETILGRDEEEYTTLFHQCGLCALGRKRGHINLIPYMCKMDFMSIDLMGGVLHRTKTLAEGGDCCDFYVCKKGSKWEKEWQEKNKKQCKS